VVNVCQGAFYQNIGVQMRDKPSMSTTKPVLKRFRVQGAFLKSPLVAPAGAKYPSRLAERIKIGLKPQTIDGRQEF